MRFFISLRLAFNQGFLIFSANLVTSAKFLGSGMQWDTSEPDSPKLVNSYKISNTIVLNTLCKPFTILCVALNAPFRCDFFFLTRSLILRRASLLSMFGWVWFPSRMSCNVSVLIRSPSNFYFSLRFSISCLLIIIDSLSYSSSLYVSLRVSLIKFLSSNCVNVITSPVCSLEDIAYGVYVTAGRIAVASAYGRDVYDNALDFFCQTQHRTTKLPF